MVYHLKGELGSEQQGLLAASVNSIYDPIAEVRMAGMKLLGAVLSSSAAGELLMSTPSLFYQVITLCAIPVRD